MRSLITFLFVTVIRRVYGDDDNYDEDGGDEDDCQVGEAILGVFAIFIRDYFTLQWVMSVVTLVQVNS